MLQVLEPAKIEITHKVKRGASKEQKQHGNELDVNGGPLGRQWLFLPLLDLFLSSALEPRLLLLIRFLRFFGGFAAAQQKLNLLRAQFHFQ